MKRITTMFALAMLAMGLFGQPLTGVSWVQWNNEPDYEGVTGYMENPYENPVVNIPMAPPELDPTTITDAAGFDMAWDALGEELHVANLTSNGVAGDLFDLDDAATFGAAWKGVHDGSAFYVMLKYWDKSGQVDDGSRTFEICAQPTAFKYHQPTYDAYTADSSENENLLAYQNQAWARFVELGGGKAVFADGQVTAYEASIGLGYDKKAWIPYTTGSWGSNDAGLLGLATATHFWDTDEEGTIRAIMVMSFDGALGYPADISDLEGDYMAVKPSDTIAFDVKSNAQIGETDPAADSRVEYFWSADRNNGYASNYYSGYVVFEEAPPEPGAALLTGVSWVQWDNEPDYEGVTGYEDNPYETPMVDILEAPEGWSYESITDAATFESTWAILGDSMGVGNLTSNGTAGAWQSRSHGSPERGGGSPESGPWPAGPPGRRAGSSKGKCPSPGTGPGRAGRGPQNPREAVGQNHFLVLQATTIPQGRR